MSNKIDAYSGTAPTLAVRAVARPHDATAPMAQNRAPERDSVALTGEARMLQQVERQARADSGIDENKVAEIRQLLAQGLYQPDPQVIANRLLQMERDYAA